MISENVYSCVPVCAHGQLDQNQCVLCPEMHLKLCLGKAGNALVNSAELWYEMQAGYLGAESQLLCVRNADTNSTGICVLRRALHPKRSVSINTPLMQVLLESFISAALLVNAC